MAPEEIREALAALGAERAVLAEYPTRGVHVDASLAPERLRAACQALRDRGFLIESVTAVDAAPRLMAIYHFVHPEGGCRTLLRVLADREAPEVPSIQDIYPGANWHEREAHDFFGIVFQGHPDLSPLILPEDAGDLRPLRKDEKRLKPLTEVVPDLAPPGDAAPEKPSAGKKAAAAKDEPEGQSEG